MKKAILILGPPRSGTSAISHILNKLGVNFGSHDRFVDPVIHPWNPIFFELQSLNNLNDEIFSCFSKTYANFDWLPIEDDFDLPLVEEFEKKIISFIQEEFGSANLIGLKDPRFCFTLPIWDLILKRCGFNVTYVLSRRSSSAVFSSNIKENKFPPEINFRLVAQSVLLARRFLEGKTYLTVNYEALISSPKETISYLCENLDLERSLIDEASAVIRHELCHQLGNLSQPIYKFFDSIIDAKIISPEEYLLYREIFLAARVKPEYSNFSPAESDTPGFDLQISSELDRLRTQLADKSVYIVKLEKELAERTSLSDRWAEANEKIAQQSLEIATLRQQYQCCRENILRSEAQLELLKDLLLDGDREGL